MAKQLVFAEYDRLHHSLPPRFGMQRRTELLVQANKLVGGGNAVPVIDDTAILKKGTH